MSVKKKVVCVKDISHDEWLAFRRTGIGGSDAATVVGLNPYSSPYYLFCDKRGELAEKEDMLLDTQYQSLSLVCKLFVNTLQTHFISQFFITLTVIYKGM